MDDDTDPIRESYRLLDAADAQLAAHEQWKVERAERAVWDPPPIVANSPPVVNLPPPPSPREERRAAAAPTPTFSQMQIDAIGQVIAGERAAMRQHVAGELVALRNELATQRDEINQLRAELGVRAEIDAMRQQMAILRADRAAVLDLPALPERRRGAA